LLVKRREFITTLHARGILAGGDQCD